MLTTLNRVAGALLPALVSVLVIWGATGCRPAGVRALEQGERLRQQGRAAEAIGPLTEAASLLRTNAQAWNRLGLASHAAGQVTNALKAYRQAILFARDRDPDTMAEVRFNLGCLHLEQGDHAAAESEFAAYTLLRPKSAEGWVRLASAQLRSRRHEQAERSYSQALAIDRQNAEALNGVGVLMMQKRRPRDAYNYFAAALQSQPGYPPALLNLALVAHHQLNLRPLALQKYREYLALTPPPANAASVSNLAARLQAELKPPSPAPVPAPVPSPAPATGPTNAVARTATNTVPVPSPPTNPIVAVAPTQMVSGRPAPANPVQTPLPVLARPTPPVLVPASVEIVRTESAPSLAPVVAPPVLTPPPRKPDPRPTAAPRTNLLTRTPTNTSATAVDASVTRTTSPSPPPQPVEEPSPTIEVVRLPDDLPEPKVGAAVRLPDPPPAPERAATVIPPTTREPEPVPPAREPAPAVSAPAPEPLTTPVETAPDRIAARIAQPPPEPAKKPGFLARMNPVRWFGGGDEAARRERSTIPLPGDPPREPVLRVPATRPAAPQPKPEAPVGRPAPTNPAPPAPAPKPKLPVPRYKRLSPAIPAAGDRIAADDHFSKALEAHRKAEWRDAIEGYSRAVAADPTFYEAQHNLTLAALNGGETARALVAAETALALRPEPEARYNFGLALQRAGFSLDAVEQLKSLLKANPEHTPAHFLLGNLFFQDLDDPVNARPHYLKVLELEPNHPQAVTLRYWLAANP